jgi:light-regulated signal transduction histidine kinase (bacteriophytochrome)
MRALIKGLMEYARIGKKEDFTAIDCNAIISDVLSDLSEKISNSKAVIEVQTLPNIKGQSTYIRLLFQNLISNAIKFVNPDVQPIIRISCSETLKEWKFSVEDNGIGIDQKHIDQIFIIFKRLNNDTLYKGYGIGLAHCKKIVDLHHGEIHVNSIVDKGSTFSFTISKNLL